MTAEQSLANGALNRKGGSGPLAFIHPSFPEQLSTNMGQPSQDTPCELFMTSALLKKLLKGSSFDAWEAS